MGQHIRRTGNGHPPQPHRPGRLSRFIAISILMDIIPVTDTRDTLSCHPQHFQILGRGNFFVSRFSLRDMHGVSAQFKQTGVVSDNPAFLFRTLMGSPQKSEGKTLRGLNRHQMFPIRCGNDLFFFIHHFNGIHHGNAGDTCGDTLPRSFTMQPVQYPVDQHGRNKRPCRIVDQDLHAIIRQSGQAVSDGVLTQRSASDNLPRNP